MGTLGNKASSGTRYRERHACHVDALTDAPSAVAEHLTDSWTCPDFVDSDSFG